MGIVEVRGLRVPRWAVTAAVAATILVAGSGTALAVSGGGYSPAQQNCSKGADAYNRTDAEAGCHAFTVAVESGGTRYAEAGIDQMPNGSSTPGLFGVGTPGSDNFPHAGCAAANTNGTNGGPGTECGDGSGTGLGATAAGDTNTQQGSVTPQTGTPDVAGAATNLATNGVNLYLGADDNLDAGEHDGVDNNPANGADQNQNGPSDGGAVQAHVSPQEAGTAPTSANPVPVAGAAFGSCADGICEEATTYQQVIYQGGATDGRSRDVTDYSTKQWDPQDCSSGSLKDEQACHDATHQNMNDYRNDEGTVYAEPGVQLYEDPDPQGSPITSDPLPVITYPFAGDYVGTCGVTITPHLQDDGTTTPQIHEGNPDPNSGCASK